jgi:hypothetical protein
MFFIRMTPCQSGSVHFHAWQTNRRRAPGNSQSSSCLHPTTNFPQPIYRMLTEFSMLRPADEAAPSGAFLGAGLSNIFQKRNVSSPDPLHLVPVWSGRCT